MLRIERTDKGLRISLVWGGVECEMFIPGRVKRKNWKRFASCLFGDIGYSRRWETSQLFCTEQRTEISDCPDERWLFSCLKENPHIFNSLVEAFCAGERRNTENNTRMSMPTCTDTQGLFGRQGVDRNGNMCRKYRRVELESKQGEGRNGMQQGIDGEQQQQSGRNGLNYEIQASTRPGLGTFATIVGKWKDVQYLRNRTHDGGTSLITTAKEISRAVCTALPGELITLIPNRRKDATGMQVLFTKSRTEGINLTQDEIDLLTYALTAIANCTGDGMPVQKFEAFCGGIRSRRESFISLAFNDRDNGREELVTNLFNDLMVKAWDYASGIIPFD